MNNWGPKWQLFRNHEELLLNRLGDTVLWLKKLNYCSTNDSKSFTTGERMIQNADLVERMVRERVTTQYDAWLYMKVHKKLHYW